MPDEHPRAQAGHVDQAPIGPATNPPHDSTGVIIRHLAAPFDAVFDILVGSARPN